MTRGKPPRAFEAMPHEEPDLPDLEAALRDLLAWLEGQTLPPRVQRAAKAVKKALRENGGKR